MYATGYSSNAISYGKIPVFLARLLIAPGLGHGRATEFLLTCMAGSYGLALVMFPELGLESQATRDIFWRGDGGIITTMLLVKAALSGWGLTANIRGWPLDRPIRFAGALIGAWVWIWFVCQFNFNSATGSVGTFACFWFFIFSARIMGMSILGLPSPGKPSAL